MTSSVTAPFGSPPSLCYRLPIVTYPLAALVSEIFDLKVADKPTDRQNSTLTDNKGALKLSAREPTELCSLHSKQSAETAWRYAQHAMVGLSYGPKRGAKLVSDRVMYHDV